MSLNLSAALLVLCLGVSLFGRAQQPPPPPPPAQAPPAESQSHPEKQGKHANDLFLFGTVFTQQGFTLPGALLQLRRAGEKKVRAENITNRAGEFALNAPRGVEYELTVKAKGFEDQSQKIEANSGNRPDIVFRMKPVSGGKKK
jgi:hypothetical protein